MATYRMILAVDSRALATMVSLVEGSPDVKLLGVTDFADPAPLPPSPPAPIVHETLSSPKIKTSPRFAGGKKNKGVSGENLVIETLRSGSSDLSELKRVFTHRGFAPTSASPTLSRMIRDGDVERGPHGRFQLTSRARNGGARQ
jgi:hypothetical protein